MHITTHVSTAVKPSDLGALAVTELKMLTKTRNRVTSNAMRPEIKEKELIGLPFLKSKSLYWFFVIEIQIQ
jgi:hypothetical protein